MSVSETSPLQDQNVSADDRRGSERFQTDPEARAADAAGGLFSGDGPIEPLIRRRDRLHRGSLQIADALGVVGAILAAVALTELPHSLAGVLVSAGVVWGVMQVSGANDKDALVLRRDTIDEIPRIAEVSALAACAYWLMLPEGPGRLPLVELFVALVLGLVLTRAAARASLRWLATPERCLFMGDPSLEDMVREKVASARTRAQVVGSIPLCEASSAAEFGGLDGLRRIVNEARASRIILAPVSVSAIDTLELVRIAKEAHVRVSILPRLFEVVGTAVEHEELEGMMLMGVKRFGLSRAARRTKRTFDLVGAGLVALTAMPVIGVIAVLVKLDSRGPVFFTQTRVGRDGKPFQIMKFRSMVDNADALKHELRHANETEGLFKIGADPRVTRIGRLLRATSLDELPQLINVLRGDMSLVGPRPLIVDEDLLISGLDRRRLHLTPGMTGPWQIMRSGRVPMHEMVGIDYQYVSNWSLWVDIKVLLRTVGYVLSRGGV